MKKKELKRKISQLYAAIDMLIYAPEAIEVNHIKWCAEQRRKRKENHDYFKGERWEDSTLKFSINSKDVTKAEYEAYSKEINGEPFVIDPKLLKQALFINGSVAEFELGDAGNKELEEYRAYHSEDVLNTEFDLKLTPDQIKVGEWIEKHNGITPDQVICILLEYGIISTETHVTISSKTDRQKIAFLNNVSFYKSSDNQPLS